MSRLVVVFVGWASPKKLYIDFIPKGYDIAFADNFDITKSKINFKKYKEIIFFSWSMGTIQSLKWRQKIIPKKHILISPTLNFTKRNSEKTVRKMIEGLNKNKKKILHFFIKLNFYDNEKFKEYWEKYEDEIQKLNVSKLKIELEFLINENISSLKFKGEDYLILVAKNDKIISGEDAIDIEKKIKIFKTITFINCGHNILYEQNTLALKIIGDYLND
ncbi:MAG: hypothetical protein B6I28_04330 [Fusobacteriia bacterium 4572_132]|nr:MAG: hypothetical protein B6I28_04330 [Fusobacteriia bacterium 4572_132]